MLICIFTGFSSGLPLWLLINLLPAWLRSEQVDLDFDRPVRTDATAVYLEISVVALARPIRAADARPPTRLDVDYADRAAGLHPAVRLARA